MYCYTECQYHFHESMIFAEPSRAFGNALSLPRLRIEDLEENKYSTCKLQLTIDYYSLKPRYPGILIYCSENIYNQNNGTLINYGKTYYALPKTLEL